MLIKQAELLFQAGVLQVPIIKQADSGNGWTVTLEGTHKLTPELETARGGTRIFKKLDIAVGVLFELGFGEIKIIR